MPVRRRVLPAVCGALIVAAQFRCAAVPVQEPASPPMATRTASVAPARPFDAEPAVLRSSASPTSTQATDSSAFDARQRPSIVPGRRFVRGPLPAKAVARAVRKRLSFIDACYERYGSPGQAFAFPASYSIGPDGRMAQVYFHCSESAPPGLVDCLEDELMAIRFPRPTGGGIVFVYYPAPPAACPADE